MPLSVLAWWHDAFDLETLAVIRVPVADMLMRPASALKVESLVEYYGNLPIAYEGTGLPSNRVHQMVMNEVLMNVSKEALETHGELPNAIYGIDESTGHALNEYWTMNNNIILLSELKKMGLSLDLLPRPMWLPINDDSVLTLKLPWFDVHNQLQHSLGARFVRNPKLDNERYYAVRYIDFRKMAPINAMIPKDRAIIEMPKYQDGPRKRFMALIRLWANKKRTGLIPYVLGGSSFLGGYPDECGALLEDILVAQTRMSIWTRSKKTSTESGLDCSELIWRAAQMVGISFYYKNTAMMKKHLSPIGVNEQIHEGDILWVPGHVAIIDDLKNGSIIEASGYANGYGDVHRVSLNERLGFKSLSELLTAYKAGRLVHFLPLAGSPNSRIDWPDTEWQLLRLIDD